MQYTSCRQSLAGARSSRGAAQLQMQAPMPAPQPLTLRRPAAAGAAASPPPRLPRSSPPQTWQPGAAAAGVAALPQGRLPLPPAAAGARSSAAQATWAGAGRQAKPSAAMPQCPHRHHQPSLQQGRQTPHPLHAAPFLHAIHPHPLTWGTWKSMGPLPRVLPSATAASLPGMRVPASAGRLGSMAERGGGSGQAAVKKRHCLASGPGALHGVQACWWCQPRPSAQLVDATVTGAGAGAGAHPSSPAGSPPRRQCLGSTPAASGQANQRNTQTQGSQQRPGMQPPGAMQHRAGGSPQLSTSSPPWLCRRAAGARGG